MMSITNVFVAYAYCRVQRQENGHRFRWCSLRMVHGTLLNVVHTSELSGNSKNAGQFLYVLLFHCSNSSTHLCSTAPNAPVTTHRTWHAHAAVAAYGAVPGLPLRAVVCHHPRDLLCITYHSQSHIAAVHAKGMLYQFVHSKCGAPDQRGVGSGGARRIDEDSWVQRGVRRIDEDPWVQRAASCIRTSLLRDDIGGTHVKLIEVVH